MKATSFWLVISSGAADGQAAACNKPPLAFADAQRMAAYLAATKDDCKWMVQLVDRDSASKIVADLKSRGIAEVFYNPTANAVDGAKIAVADLLAMLEGNA